MGRDPAKTKQSQLIALLGAASGASMSQMTSLTGWLPHTVRGTISAALRKRLGLNVPCQFHGIEPACLGCRNIGCLAWLGLRLWRCFSPIGAS
ncbi:DUF3489 domain-containing protein [Hydrogenophaga sp. BPS33]|nr:DUF3489 domain-containing protein [Hydrogenophaga sp. BPS33]